jgi:hypothetical protein
MFDSSQGRSGSRGFARRACFRTGRARDDAVSGAGLLLAQAPTELVDVVSGGREQVFTYPTYFCNEGVAPRSIGFTHPPLP